MKVTYEVWTSAGNPVAVANNKGGKYDTFFADPEAKRNLCESSGTCGIMEVKSTEGKSDGEFNLIFHISSGLTGPVPLCGTGSMCTVGFVCTHDIVPTEKQKDFTFVAPDGMHTASCRINNKDCNSKFAKVSFKDSDQVFKVDENIWLETSVNAILVKFVPVDQLSAIDVAKEGKELSLKFQHLTPGRIVIPVFVEDGPEGIFCRCFDAGSGLVVPACGTGSASIGVVYAAAKTEEDGEVEKILNWSKEQIIVRCNKEGNNITHLSLESKVACIANNVYDY